MSQEYMSMNLQSGKLEKIYNWIKNNRKFIFIATALLIIMIMVIVLLSTSGSEQKVVEHLKTNENSDIIDDDDNNQEVLVKHEKEYQENKLYKYGYDLVKAIQNENKEKRSEYANKLYYLAQSAACRNSASKGERNNQFENDLSTLNKTYDELSKATDQSGNLVGKYIINNMPAFYIDSIKLRNPIGFLIFTLTEATKQNKIELRNEMLYALVQIGRDNLCKMDLNEREFKQPQIDPTSGKKIWSTIWESSLKKDEKGQPLWN